MKEKSAGIPLWLVLGVDALTAAAVFLWLPHLLAQFKTNSGSHVIILLAAYFVFAMGVYLHRRLRPTPDGSSEWFSPAVRGGLAIFFGLWLTTAIAWQLGYFDSFYLINTRALGEGPTASYFVFAPGAWLAISMVYLLVLAFPVTETTVYPGRRYWISSIMGLLATAVMLLLAAAQLGVMVKATGQLLSTLAIGCVLLLLFAPARWLYVTRTMATQRRFFLVAIASLVIVIMTIMGRLVTL